MKNKRYTVLSKIFFVIALSLGIYSLYYAIAPDVFLSAGKSLIWGFVTVIFIFVGVYFHNKTVISQSEKDKASKTAHIIAFLYYSVNLVCEIWFNACSNRLSGFSLTEHFTKYRILPFETVTYVLGLYGRNLNFGYLLSNLLGNFLAYMPLSYFLPYFSRKMRKTAYFGAVLFVIVTFFEVVQAFFCLGEFDTDDILFNFIGAFALYLIIMKLNIFRKK